MNILLKSPYECLVKTNSQQIELSKNDCLQICDEDYLFIYPQKCGQIPFYINLNSLCDCDNYSVHVRDDKTYLILENYANFEVKMKENLNFSGKNCKISISNKILSFEYNGKCVSCACQSPNDYTVFKIKSFACVQFAENLYIFSTKQCKLYHFFGEIEIDGDKVTVTKKINDSASRQRKSVFLLNDDLEILEEIYTRAEGSKKNLAPYKLLESVKARDYACAVSFLTKSLQEKVGTAQLQDFFGNFSTFLPISTTQFITMAGKKKNFVTFSLSGDLIDEISIDEF